MSPASPCFGIVKGYSGIRQYVAYLEKLARQLALQRRVKYGQRFVVWTLLVWSLKIEAPSPGGRKGPSNDTHNPYKLSSMPSYPH